MFKIGSLTEALVGVFVLFRNRIEAETGHDDLCAVLYPYAQQIISSHELNCTNHASNCDLTLKDCDMTQT